MSPANLRRLFCLLFLALSGLPLQAGILTLTTCEIEYDVDPPVSQSIQSPTACAFDLTPPGGDGFDEAYATASASRSFGQQMQLLGDSYMYSSAFDNPDDGGIRWRSLRTASLIDMALGATTPGPVRDGLIEIAIDFRGGTYEGEVSGEWGIGNLGGIFFADNGLPRCTNPLGGPNWDACTMEATAFPFVLGKPFDVSLNLSLHAGSDPTSPGESSAKVTIDVRFLELDRTPVAAALTSVPEPSTLLLLASVLPFLLRKRIGRRA